MEIAVTGSRSISDFNIIYSYLDRMLSNLKDFTIVTGGYTSVDKIARQYAIERDIPFREVVPDFERHKRRAFYQRNLILLDCDKAVVFWDGKSPGTAQFIHRCNRYNVPYRLKNITP